MAEQHITWLKTVSKNKRYKVQAFEIDCKEKRINQTVTVMYGFGGQVLSRQELASGWQPIVPDTMGERLTGGSCSVR
jgi:hypothetical protein